MGVGAHHQRPPLGAGGVCARHGAYSGRACPGCAHNEPPRRIGLYVHSVRVRGNPTGARALIEARLGVETVTEPSGDGETWLIFFNPPTPGEKVDLDFLRPDVLPPK